MAKATTQSTYGALPITGFIRLADLRTILPVSDSTIWRRVRDGSMPRPLKLSERVTVWRAEEIRAWLDQLSQQAA
ncbi:helix-turn-helix transcriptional regulator [Chromobacterium violaceum]|uniref:helix-turn-helix transcriptional regulator n=1 Tax=Chromobacterium violaceum TaxID=536 RepID=UPI001B333DFB|nr:AlpA family phage regulatory protein [Chromobacterium violaceum]MBP4043497.1 AlpA family phage regulatory protein [Chromobacterium violaceum]